MVFHDIESVTEVLADHRVIIYYIEGKLTGIKRNDIKLCKKVLEVALEMLEKKNEDMLIIKILHGSDQFLQFDELYKPDVTGAATLFVVNNEGIPIMCEQINHAESVSNVVESLSTNCKLNRIQKLDINKITQSDNESTYDLVSDNLKLDVAHNSKHTSSESSPKSVAKIADKHEPIDPVESASTHIITQETIGVETEQIQLKQPQSTELRIILPNGNRDTHKFDKNVLLQDVWVVIKTTYNLGDFDLKTFDRQQTFTEEEYKTSLENLKLYPNGVILVVLKNVVSFNSNRSIGQFIYNGFSEIMVRSTSVFQYVQGLFLWVWNGFLFNNNRPSGNNQPGRQSRALQGGSNNQNSSQQNINKPKPASKSFGGNVHTLRRHEDSDDENNRYNGNSTQQK